MSKRLFATENIAKADVTNKKVAYIHTSLINVKVKKIFA